MFKYRLFFVSLFILVNKMSAQVLPREGSVLNYRLIGLSYINELKTNTNYKFEIAKGSYKNDAEFNAHVTQTLNSRTFRTVAEVPTFSSDYTWRVTVKDSHGITKSGLYHFSTGYSSQTDTSINRLRVLKPTEQYEAYVFLDNSRALYDMKGQPVWYLPSIKGVCEDGTSVKDIKVSPSGTITFIGNNDVPFEVNYDGEVIWSGPNNGAVSGDRSEHYHHEFSKLANGHYMVLGSESVTEQDKQDSNPLQFGTLIEYDKAGKVVWSWRSYKYYEQSDLVNYASAGSMNNPDLHENSFFFDEKDQYVYLSFKNISRIIKIKYPEGNVVSTFGEQYKPGTQPQGNGLFCGQHACKYSQIGCLFLFNNNGCNPGNAPKVKILKEQAGEKMGIKKIWEYDCVVEGTFPKEAPTGGNVIELSDHSAFVSMGGAYSKVFIVNMDKKELWSALPERWVAEERKWCAVKQYRASIINNRDDMERLIWGKDNKKAEMASK